MLSIVTWCAAFTILGVALLWCVHQNRRQPPPPTRLERLLAEHHAAERDRIETLADVVSQREQEPQSLAWPQIERLPPSAACPECTWWYEDSPVYWPCPSHDPGFVSEWEGRLSL